MSYVIIEHTLLPTMVISAALTFLLSEDEDKFTHMMGAIMVSGLTWVLVALVVCLLLCHDYP